jgi:hypothetical protein
MATPGQGIIGLFTLENRIPEPQRGHPINIGQPIAGVNLRGAKHAHSPKAKLLAKTTIPGMSSPLSRLILLNAHFGLSFTDSWFPPLQ